MANRIPLVFDAVQEKFKELPSGDNLNMANSSIVDAINISATGAITATTVNTTNLNVNGNSLADVATSNDYNDLNNLPTLFSGDYNDLTNRPTAISSDWADISNKPTIPTKLSQLTNDANFVTNNQISITPNQVAGIAQVAKTNNYNDLTNRITAVSQLTNDANYITAEDVAGGTLTVEVNNTGNLEGSVFGSDSTVIIDHLNNTVNLTGGPVSGETDIGSTNNRFSTQYMSGFIDFEGSLLSGGADETIRVTGLTLQPKGTTLDAYSAQLNVLLNVAETALDDWQRIEEPDLGPQWAAYQAALQAFNEYQSFVTNAKTLVYYNAEDQIVASDSPFGGRFKGDLTGSVFADDSTVLIDAISGKHTGVFDGDLTGSVFGDDSTLIVDGVNKTVNATNVYATTHWGNLSKTGTILSVSADNGIQLLPNGQFNIPNATTIDIDASDTIDITATNDLNISSSSGSVIVDGYISIADLKTLVAGAATYGEFQTAIANL